MMPWRLGAALAALAATAAPAAGGDELQLAFRSGRVTVVAADVPLAAILAAWTERGDTRFVDMGGLPPQPVSVHMVDVAESEALRVLLRAAGGYIAVPRAASEPGGSAFEQVLIMTGRAGRRQGRRPAAGPARFGTPAGVAAGRPSTPRVPGPGGLPPAERPALLYDDDDELDDLELLDLLRRRYEEGPDPDARTPAFFPAPAAGAGTGADPGTARQPGMVLQSDAPPAQPLRPSSRPRRRTGAP